MVKFDEASHTYVVETTGEELISVTTLLGKYKPSFDSGEAAERVASREGLTKEFILEQWETEKNKACEYGTHIHKVMEYYIKEGIELEKYKSLYRSYDRVSEIFKKYPIFKSEEILFNLEFSIAGTSDLIYENSTHFWVGDFKTNKKFRYSNDFDSYFLNPLSHLPVCEFNAYALQLSLYAFLYEIISGKKCAGLVLFYEQRSTHTWNVIYANYLKREVDEMLHHYRAEKRRPILL